MITLNQALPLTLAQLDVFTRVFSSNFNATREIGEPDHAGSPAGKSVWWYFLAEISGFLTVSTLGSTADGFGLDTTLGVYTGTSVGNLTVVAKSDESNEGLGSEATFPVQTGTKYFIAVDGFADPSGNVEGGNISLSIYLSVAPVNDNFNQALPLTFAQPQVSGSNANATRETDELFHADRPGGKSVWWSFLAETSGFLTVSTLGSTRAIGIELDTTLGVYTGTSVGNLTLVAKNDDSHKGVTSEATFPIQAGTTYFIAVDAYADHSGNVDEGNISLKISYEHALPVISAPPWNLPDMNGTAIRSTDFAGQVILLNFWATWCGPCIDEIPDLIKLHDQYKRFGFTVIGVSVDDAVGGLPPAELVRSFAQSHGMEYPMILGGPGSTVELDYGGIPVVPTTFVIDRKNHIVREIVGAHSKSQFESYIIPYLFDQTTLSVKADGSNILIQWPTLPATTQLEYSDSLPGTAWNW